ncbi:RagB/SusD family nutrient uptake outer membrane protein [Paraflavitalea sp. CAU 1676]|uniref:RagB/SusD family nutrient uptake outer membrane protein n=1 Tax=Paraflavitalea sp. CAU 1676 TaxID=3032598 RepID=UPI0023DB9CAD|nr:RagB/SusD family nutrient uptake outer membrane protein [Paraflavitalea sp. CAU 1676]MDF2193491.1 RagB/SusD family nutrient uptake outer membrane protein [Paraflavitalea sp. CAU 1676]
MKKLSFLLLYIMLLHTSCKKFLTEEFKSLINRANFYRTDQDAIAAVNAVYQTMRFDVTNMAPLFIQDWMSDDGTVGTSNLDARLDMEYLAYDSRHTDIRDTWSNAYRTIERANNVVAFVNDSTKIKGEVVRRVTGEARFLRAFYYFRLVQLFGGVPLMLEPADVVKNNLTPARATETEVYQVIIDDLQYAEANLDDYYAYNDSQNGGRATRAAAKALLGKVYLTMAGFPLKDVSKYQLAADKLKELIDNNLQYSVGLNTNYSNIFHTSAANKAADRERIFYSKGTSGMPPNLLAYTWLKNKYTSLAMALVSNDFNLYSFTAGTNAYTNLAGGTSVPSVQVDEAISGALPIGFTFNFGGLKVDKFYMCSNGFISFVPRTVSPTGMTTSKDPLIGPLLDNLNGAGGEASYATTGAAPNRVLTVQWKNWRWRAGTTVSNNISFQVKLYEGDGKFEMLYDQLAPPVNAVATATAVRTSAFFSSIRNAGTAPGFNWVENSTTYYYSVNGFQPGQVFTYTPNPRSVYEWADMRRITLVNSALRIVKYNDPINSLANDNADDYFWLRYSDVLLMYAEALAQMGGAANMDIALAQLNAIRLAHGGTTGTGTTPALSDLTFGSQEELINLVKQERRRELAFENHRWYDLKRWGILPATIISHLANQYNRPESDFSYINDNMNYLPIPYSDIVNNPNLVQNKGY